MLAKVGLSLTAAPKAGYVNAACRVQFCRESAMPFCKSNIMTAVHCGPVSFCLRFLDVSLSI